MASGIQRPEQRPVQGATKAVFGMLQGGAARLSGGVLYSPEGLAREMPSDCSECLRRDRGGGLCGAWNGEAGARVINNQLLIQPFKTGQELGGAGVPGKAP